MSKTIHILKDSTETLEAILPPEYPGPPTSPAVRIYTGSTPLPDSDTWTNATAEGLSTTTNAEAKEGTRTLSFASPPGFVAGRTYTIDVDDGVEFVPLNDGTSVTTQSPLPVDIPSGSTIYSRTVSIALTATQTEVDGPGFAYFRATDANSVQRIWRVAFEVVKATIQAPLTEAELFAMWPNARNEFPSEGSADEIIQSAWVNEVLPELRAQGIEEELIFNVEPLRPWLLEAIRWMLLRDRDELPRDDLERAQKRALASSDWWEARDREAEVPSPDAAPRPWGTFTMRR